MTGWPPIAIISIALNVVLFIRIWRLEHQPDEIEYLGKDGKWRSIDDQDGSDWWRDAQ